jgi:alcohol dehydrogenase class IV
MVETWSREPDRVVFGAGAEAMAAELLAELGAERVLLIAAARHTDGAERIAAALGARAAGVLVTDRPQVPADVADAAVARAREVGADWVLAHGGGTPIGVGKAIALELPVSLAAVPTTYAGSERNDLWGITRDGRKITGRDPRVRPRLVIYDPALTLDLDRAMSLDSLFNALAHSLEALYAGDATDDARGAAEASLEPLLDGVRAIAREPRDAEGRAPCPTAPAAASSASCSMATSGCPSAGRSAPTASPTSATSSRRPRPSRTTSRRGRSSSARAAACGRWTRGARRSTWSRGTGRTRRSSTTSRASTASAASASITPIRRS